MLFTFFLEIALFFHFFPNKKRQVKKIQNQKHMLVGRSWGGLGGSSNYLNPKIHQINFFIFLKI
jgi:hypothetical protein